jgi:protein-disulfide isomerase
MTGTAGGGRFEETSMLVRPRRALLGLFLTLSAVVVLAAPSLVHAEDKVGDRPIMLGNPRAPITIIEYGSITCPHCARFNAEVLPAIKAKYIDTGRANYVFRDFPIHPQEDAAGFLVARCAGPEHYMAVVDALFKAQPEFFEKQNLHAFLMAGASAGGLSEEQMRACINDPAGIQAFMARGQHAQEVDKVDGTPTVIINGKKVDQAGPEMAISDIDAVMKPLLGGKASGAPAKPTRRPAAH